MVARHRIAWLGIPCVAALALASACGGGGGQDPAPAGFVTADARGIAAFTGGGAWPPSGAAGAAEADADRGLDEIARRVEEADLYRLDGDLLYLLSAHRGLGVADLSACALRGRLGLAGYPLEMFLRGERAFVLLAGLDGATRLAEVRVADPDAPALVHAEAVPGAYRTSRLVGDVLYLLTEHAVHSFWIGASPLAPVAVLALPEGCDVAHATDALLCVAARLSDGGTRLRLVDLADPGGALTLRGYLDVPGTVADDKKLHFGAGTLRVATHDASDRGLSHLTVVGVGDPDRPAVLGALELARGEQLFGTVFTEDRAYLVTFEQVDPLWVVDLSDPAAPRILGELEVPGFSTQIVADGPHLLALGFDPAFDGGAVVSLFDVADPRRPRLVDREGLGPAGAGEALWDRKAFGVDPAHVLVGGATGLWVLEREAGGLGPARLLPVAGGARRGFEAGPGLIALGPEEVVVADPATLAARCRVEVAALVVDTGRLGDGRRLDLVQRGDRAFVGGVERELWANALHVVGQRAAVEGHDAAGRCVDILDFATEPPGVLLRVPVGPRFPLFHWAPFPVPESGLTAAGRLVLRDLPGADAREVGSGAPADGLVVVDLEAAAAGVGVRVRGGVVTGWTLAGEALVFTWARSAGVDGAGRPLLRHQAGRLDLATGTLTAEGEVPGFVVAAAGDTRFTVEERWAADWQVECDLLAVRPGGGQAEVLDRLPLAPGAWDFRAAGGTLLYGTGAGLLLPLLDGAVPGAPLLPDLRLHSVRLGVPLARGPSVGGDGAFRWPLWLDDAAVLVARDGLSVERWALGGPTALRLFEAEPGGHPTRARPDPAEPGRYLVVLGYGGVASVP